MTFVVNTNADIFLISYWCQRHAVHLNVEWRICNFILNNLSQ